MWSLVTTLVSTLTLSAALGAPVGNDANAALAPADTASAVSLVGQVTDAPVATEAQLLAKARLEAMLGPLGTDLDARMLRVDELQTEAEEPLTEGLAELEIRVLNTTSRLNTTRTARAGIPQKELEIDDLREVADATAKRATADKGNLTLRCEAQLGTIERRLAKLQGDQEIVMQLSQWLTSIADEWGDATMLAQLTSLISKLNIGSELQGVALLSEESTAGTLTQSTHESVVGKVSHVLNQLNELISGLHSSHSDSVLACSKENALLESEILTAQNTVVSADNMATALAKSKTRLTESEETDAAGLVELEQQKEQLTTQRESLRIRWTSERTLLNTMQETKAALVASLANMV